MESPYQKYVTISYVALGVMLAYVVFAFGAKLGGVYDLEARVRDFNLILQGVSAGIGLLLFIILWRNDQANQFMNEVIVELARVTWPTQKETTSSTFVVIVMVILSGLFLGFLDYVWNEVIGLLLRWNG